MGPNEDAPMVEYIHKIEDHHYQVSIGFEQQTFLTGVCIAILASFDGAKRENE